MSRTPAVERIISDYSISEFYEILEYGCNSEIAYRHAAYSDTTGFYDTYREEVESYIYEHFGRKTLAKLSESTRGDIEDYKSKATWTFIEGVAQSVITERTLL